MPFHDGAYYPYSSDTQGTHSSAGIPSLLNSPLSQHCVNGHSVPAPGMTPSNGTPTVLPFKFRPRRESVDWRRISAVDIDMVMSQLDVDTLQEHINMVTFCRLDGERCQRCQSPIDPALVRLLQLAQLTVEWLLHCQEILTLNLHAAEKRLSAAGNERELLLAQQKKQEEKVKALTAELKQRKKIIRTQQSMLAPRIISSNQKCPLCEKLFMNSFFLQNHMQRCHPDEYELQLRSDNEKKSQIESLKLEISSLKEQIVQQQQDVQAKTVQEKEQQSMHKELLREVERKIEDSRDGIRREMEFLYTRNIQAVNEANQNQTAKHEKPASPVHLQPERDLDNYKEMQIQAIQKLEQQIKKQAKKWESTVQDIKAQHESEKNQLLNELSRMQSFVSDQQERSQMLQQEMERRQQEMEQTIKAQREQIRNISSSPPIKVVEVPVTVSAPAPEPKPKRVVLDSSSFSERRPVDRRPEPAPEKKQRATSSVLKRNTSIKKEMRPVIEQAVTVRMESLGVKPDQSGLKNKELPSILAKAQSKRESFAKGTPEYWRQREEITSTMEQKLGIQRRGSDPALESQGRSRQPVQVLQIRPRSSSLPSRTTQVKSGPAVKQPKTPQPAPRTRTTAQPKTSTPSTRTALRNITSKTPPFSSDESSEEEETDMEEQPQKHQRGKSPQSRLTQATPVQIRASKASPAQARQAPAKHSFSSNQQQQQATASAGGVTKTAVTKMDSDEEEEEWSEVSELREIDPRQLQSHRDQNGNVDKRNFGKENKINDLARKMEKQFAGRAVKKPAGGVSILPEKKDEVQELTYTDLEESSEWMVSSLEDRQEMSKPAQGSGPMRKSLDSPSTSVWGTSTGRGPKSGLTEAGTGSTLKSSLCSISDISDSEDISNNHYKPYS